ncbi:MAG: hypothetical protein HND40_05480 [Ignavibacteriota bacterium]|nr:hypothetical protein [Ignavibacteriota bacterium]MCO6446657.1 hypothetical protein [Ignavibacterium album]MCZ2267655.1 hypothetical protein [Ignavibacteriales bacterium]QKJ99057.1 MAG: hypothetical protein HND40_05480 [Ignavibacteriota bacterium]HOJ07006.1 hypothetical protein [Ignavibacteriaceae bacterium]
MDLIKNYINQSISIAANNLRLNNQQIEVVALLKETISKSDKLSDDLINMKKITELSTLAIRLNDIYNSLTQNPIDFLKMSDQFKEHSRFLIKDLGHMLDVCTPVIFKSAIEKLKGIDKDTKEEIRVDLSKRVYDDEPFERSQTDEIKEEIIFEEAEETETEEIIQNFESIILSPIKPLDNLLKKLSDNDVEYEELIKFSKIMDENASLSRKIGFEILSGMHRIVSKALILIKNRDLMPGKEVIESLRACLIVIVAVVRGKDVDINNYLNKAERFGNQLLKIKSKDTK